MILIALGVILGLLISRKMALHLVSNGTLSGTVVGVIGMFAAAITGAAVGFVVSTVFGFFLPMSMVTKTALVQPLSQEGIFVQQGTKDHGRFYRFLEGDEIKTVPLVQTSFFYTNGPQRMTAKSYVFSNAWENWISSPMAASTYTFELNSLSPTNVVSASY